MLGVTHTATQQGTCSLREERPHPGPSPPHPGAASPKLGQGWVGAAPSLRGVASPSAPPSRNYSLEP